MKIALTCLAAALILPNVALAYQHYACMRIFEPLSQVLHVAIIDSNRNFVMDETKSFTLVSHYTIKNNRGRYDYNGKTKKWSAAFDGQDWGTYSYQERWDDGSEHMIGCYDDTGSSYCLEPSRSELEMKCLTAISN
ncbi:MAG: hypothetical protein J3Q66DRAFT_329772 [Benniella sp.]|nr:MAG: hypothetical protein J3Q66DRAFT_329772 [Benniella sp.]